MNDRCEEQLEIVGFNGSPLVECGRALPVARRPSDSRYCILQSLGKESPFLGIPRTKPTRMLRPVVGPDSSSRSPWRGRASPRVTKPLRGN